MSNAASTQLICQTLLILMWLMFLIFYYNYYKKCTNIRPSIPLSVSPSVPQSILPSICLSICLSVCPSVHPSSVHTLSDRHSVCPSICLSVCMSVFPSLRLFPSVMSVPLSTCLTKMAEKSCEYRKTTIYNNAVETLN